MTTDSATIKYAGPSRGVPMLTGMLEAEGIEVTHTGRLTESRSRDAVDVVNTVITVTGHPLVWGTVLLAVNKFRKRAPGVTVEVEGEDEHQDDEG